MERNWRGIIAPMELPNVWRTLEAPEATSPAALEPRVPPDMVGIAANAIAGAMKAATAEPAMPIFFIVLESIMGG